MISNFFLNKSKRIRRRLLKNYKTIIYKQVNNDKIKLMINCNIKINEMAKKVINIHK